jgi:hypothetical protein
MTRAAPAALRVIAVESIARPAYRGRMLRGGIAIGGGSSPLRLTLVALATIVIALAITVTTALAAATRAEYVAQVDPICQSTGQPEGKAAFAYLKALNKFNHQIAAGVRRKKAINPFVRQTTKFFGRVSRIEAAATFQIAGVPPAPGDESTVAVWIQQRTESTGLLNQAIAALKHRRLNAFMRLTNQWTAKIDESEATVAGFGFRYCVSPV